MKRAREVVLGLGGIEHSRVFTRIWLALFGEWSWDDLPALPPEVILLPRVVPAQRLRLRVLGAPDDRAAHDRRLAPARAAAAVLARRAARRARAASRCIRSRRWKGRLPAARPRAAAVRAPPDPAAALARAPARVRVDPPAPGGRRLVGRHPAALGVLGARAAPRGLSARPSRARARARTASGASRSRRATSAGSRRVSRRSGTPRSR